MVKKETVLNEIINYYLSSHDFNGLPVRQMENYDFDILSGLIDDGLIEVLSEHEVDNPHIKCLNLDIPIEQQKDNISNKVKNAVLYPTRTALENIITDSNKPYTKLLQEGEIQFKIIYFSIEILERYANNPKFFIIDLGYRGSISRREEYIDDVSLAGEYIKNYGMAHMEGKNLERAVGVYLSDLSKLSPQKQILWRGFELPNQIICKVHKHFVDNLIRGEWVTKAWIFDALIDEMIVINEMCVRMGVPELFKKTFTTDYSNKPEGYRNIFLPTLKNYYDFVLVLEKMIIHNISYETFQKPAQHINCIDRFDESGKEKGSLTMLEEWLCKNISTSENITQLIIKPLRNLRGLRQKPAHKLTSNEYDISLYTKQFDLMNDTYSAIRVIRLFFANHPRVKGITIPNYLISGEDIVNY